MSWLCANLAITSAEATVLVRLARLYDQHQVVADALEGGELSLAQARILARAERNREDDFAACVDGLVDLVTEPRADQDFGQVIADWIELVDDRAPTDDTKRRLNCSDTVNGMAHTDLFGSADDAAIIRAAIESLDTPDPEDCPEGPGRASSGTTTSRSTSSAASSPMSSARTLRATAAPMSSSMPTPPPSSWPTPTSPLRHRGPRRPGPARGPVAPYRDDASAIGCSAVPPATPMAPPLRRTVAAIMLCSGWVRRIIRDPRTGNVLDVGRAQRRFTLRQRRALVIRDGGCVFPGCDRKPKWCDAHHLQPWEDDGPTDLANGCPALPPAPQPRPPRRTGPSEGKHDRSSPPEAPDGRDFTRRPG